MESVVIRKIVLLLSVILFILIRANAQSIFSSFDIKDAKQETHVVFPSLDSLLRYASQTSITLQTGDINLLQAKKAKIAAIASIPDPNGSQSLSFTDNTKLPVSLFPAEAFGGEPGTYKKIQTGIQYNTAVNQTIDIKLLNLGGWQNLKLAKINIDVTENNNKLNKKNLYENIASSYCNIVQLQGQLETTSQNLEAAQTLFTIAENKFEEGLVKQQDVNDSKINVLNIAENIRQIKFILQQQYLNLKTLADIPDSIGIEIVNMNEEGQIARQPVQYNNLQYQTYSLKEKYALENFKQIKRAQIPTLSFVGADNYNQYNQNATLFGGEWLHSQYIGLKLNFSLPNATTISNVTKAKFDYLIAAKNTEQSKIQTDIKYHQLSVDYDKALSQYNSYKEIVELRRDTYQKNQKLYAEGLISLNETLTSFTNFVNSQYDLLAAQASLLLAKAAIKINNEVQ